MSVAGLRGTLIALAAAVPWVALGAPLVSPAAGTDAILSIRGSPTDVLRLEYRKDSGNDPGDISVGIASDYHYVSSAGELTIHDYKLRRIFRVRNRQTFINDSLYAEVWSRTRQLRNQIDVARTIRSSGEEPSKQRAAVHDPFVMETEQGVISADVPRPELKQVTDNGRISWQFNGQEVAAVRYEKQEVAPALQAGLRRFWPTFCRLHPDIAAALASSNRMPTELWVKERPFARDAVIAHWILLQSRTQTAAPYPLPAHLAARPTLDTGAYARTFATLAAATAAKHKPSPRASFSKDSGDFYAAHSQPFAAWQVWDLGRLMPGRTEGDALDTIDSVESDLVKSEHDLF